LRFLENKIQSSQNMVVKKLCAQILALHAVLKGQGFIDVIREASAEDAEILKRWMAHPKCPHTKKIRRYGYRYKNYLVCNDCRLDDMYDISRDMCESGNCMKIASYGIVGEKKPKRCSEHKLPDMVDVYHMKCDICKVIPAFGFPGEGPRRCATHKLEGMLNVVSPRCELCDVQPSFGFEGGSPRRCATHKLDGMEDLVSTLCELCSFNPIFGFPGERPRRCASHILEGMEDVKHMRCELCPIRPSYGFDGELPRRCVSHKLEGMDDVVSIRCELCPIRPIFAFDGERARRCFAHKLDGMEDVKHSHCEECIDRPYYGFEGERPRRCFSHILKGMKNVVTRQCKCNKQPSFGLMEDAVATCCNNCRKPDMVNIINKRCESAACQFYDFQDRKFAVIDNLCVMCYNALFPEKARSKVRIEHLILAEVERLMPHLQQAADTYVWDCPLNCTLKRPDMFWIFKQDYSMQLEVDETDEDHEDSTERLAEIQAAAGTKYHYVIRIHARDVFRKKRLSNGEMCVVAIEPVFGDKMKQMCDVIGNVYEMIQKDVHPTENSWKQIV
jgi:hypothetical protein